MIRIDLATLAVAMAVAVDAAYGDFIASWDANSVSGHVLRAYARSRVVVIGGAA